jgi:hypothetical protein
MINLHEVGQRLNEWGLVPAFNLPTPSIVRGVEDFHDAIEKLGQLGAPRAFRSDVPPAREELDAYQHFIARQRVRIATMTEAMHETVKKAAG